jgi:hypothetical protein
MTCGEARRRYFANYKRRRRAGEGTPIQHGTAGGYAAGCEGTDCPGGEDGRSCVDARRAYKVARARAAGVGPHRSTFPPGEAAKRVRDWLEQGISLRRIASATGVGRTTIRELAMWSSDGGANARKTCTSETIDRILAVNQLETPQPSSSIHVDAEGSLCPPTSVS